MDNRISPARPPAQPVVPPPPPAPPPRSSTPPQGPPSPVMRAAVVRATRAASAAPLGLPPSPEIQNRLDAFRSSLIWRLQTPEGNLEVTAGFLMAHSDCEPAFTNSAAGRQNIAAARALGLLPALPLIQSGRGTPAQLQALTQKLIDTGCLPPGGEPLWTRVRRMMMDHHLGLDCAGYAQQAFLSSTGLSRTQAHFTTPVNESLSSLGAAYARVAPSNAKPGDLIVLLPPAHGDPGHRAIVSDCHAASPAELQEFATRIANANPKDSLPLPPSSGHVTVLAVDSSWGNGGDPERGGVARATWYHDDVTDVWVSVHPDSWQARLHQPYAHPLGGIYRWTHP